MDYIIFTFIALLIAWIWVDYFRLIDVFERENLLQVLAIFLLGSLSVLLVLGLHMLIEDPFGITMNGEFINDYLYCIFDTGLVEESSKVLMFVVVYWIFRKHINEPIDILAAMSVCALGFAAAENVLYFSKYGAQIISARAILSTVGHMMFTSIVAYGIILVRFRNVKFGVLVLLACLLISSIFHGSYNFWLGYEQVGGFGRYITILIFFVGISVFATILNNTLNISQLFTYKHVINSSLVAKRLLLYYFLVFILQCTLFFWRTDLMSTLRLVLQNAFMVLPVVMISIVRLSRFKLIRGKWNKVRLELPFSVSFGGNSPGISLFFFRISIKGDPYSDHLVNVFFETYFHLKPISPKSSFLKHFRKAYIYDKIYLNKDQAYYAAKVFLEEGSEKHDLVLLQIKHQGKSMINNAPIVGILDVQNIADLRTGDDEVKTSFLEWACVVVIDEVKGQRAL